MDCKNYCNNNVPVCFSILYWIWSSVPKFIFIIDRKYSSNGNANCISWFNNRVEVAKIAGYMICLPIFVKLLFVLIFLLSE